ncbi:MAG TPA: polymer-forming cytoskeletal protein [Longimicrobiaceae bacterium]|nr:polymer-forming cytoskeletal protein [Longimicrobiaceae bacterium]
MRSSLVALSALLLAAAPSAAQEPGAPTAQADTVRRMDLPPEVAEEVVAFFNDRRTLHFSGRTRIPEDRSITGDVAVLRGPLSIAGRVEGRVVVINGDVELSPGAVVDGDLTVIGGRVEGLDEARVAGEVRSYSEPLRYHHRGDRIVRADRERPGRREERAEGAARRGRATFLVTTGESYNRVEGLPILFGPVIETPGSNPFRLRALAVYRTENGPFLRTERWGHDVSAEQFFGGRRELRVGAGVHSVVAPVEDWHVSDRENGLSTFLFHRDFRDHYERKGWSAYAGVDPRGLPVSLTAGYRSERHQTLPVGDPWTIFDNGDPWRPQPLVAEGRLSSLFATAKLDTRNDSREPSTGWLVRGEVEHALDDDLVRPAAIATSFTPPGGPLVVPAQAYGAFTTGLLDVRRYNRIDADSRLNLRLLVGGSLDGSPLPPQRQHALGGEGSLPGYSLFEFDCGARSGRVALPGDAASADPVAFFTRYGCDRMALVQAEYRGNLSFRFNWSGRGWWDDDEDGPRYRESVNADLDWVLFADAGRGWAGRGAVGEQTGVDAGFGLLFDELGVYAAVPLRGGSGVNLFVRLGSRF